jgi:hypothetical protein
MNNPLSAELTVLRQRALLEEANERRQAAVTAQNPLPTLVNTLLSALRQRQEAARSTADEQAHLAWVADQA